MKEKLKKINLSSITAILKSSLIGVIVSILMVLLFAFILKFVDLSSTMISLVDQIIKIISIIVAVIVLNKQSGEGLLIKGCFAGAMYCVITFIVFSILNGGFNLGLGIFSDILFSTLVGGSSAILINIIKRK